MKFNKKWKQLTIAGSVLLAATAMSTSAVAEISTVRIAQQYGISYMPLVIMQEQHLMQKAAKEAGLGDITVLWSKFAGGNVMNDAILSGDLHFASGGVGPFLTLWARTRDNYEVKGATAMNVMPLLLNTRNPDIKTLKDFSKNDRIALPAVRVSIQAITLQMGALQAFGEGQEHKLDPLTVSLSHPDAMVALLSGSSEINSHFTSPPYQYIELEKPGIHTVLNSYDVTGGPHTFNIVWTRSSFVKDNPKTYDAFLKAYNQATDFINTQKADAIRIYMDATNAKEPFEFYEKILNNPDLEFTTTPRNVMKYADFMYKTKFIKVMPGDWKELFFPNMYDKQGS